MLYCIEDTGHCFAIAIEQSFPCMSLGLRVTKLVSSSFSSTTWLGDALEAVDRRLPSIFPFSFSLSPADSILGSLL